MARRNESLKSPAPGMRFGPYRMDPQTGELWNGGTRLRVPDQPFQVLVALVEKPGQLITREELRDRLWPDDTHVDYDHALTTAVKKLRRALHDSPLHPRYIETLPKRGYRFIAPVEPTEPTALDATSALPPETEAAAPPATDRLRLQRNVALGALALFGVAGVFLLTRPEPPPDAPRLRRFSIVPAAQPENRGLRAAVSPDGSMVAWVTSEPRSPIWIRSFEREQPRRIEGTEGADLVSWSPDSQFLAFAMDSSLRRISIHGGPITTLCPLSGSVYGGSSWSPDGETIVFSTGLPPVLFEVSSRGGEARALPDPVVTPAGGGNLDPHFLDVPGRRLLAFAAGGPNFHELVVRDLDTGEQARLGAGRRPNYSGRGHLLYQADGSEGGLWALPLDIERLSGTGPPALVAETGVHPTVSRDGILVYVDEPRIAPQQLALYDRSGERMTFIGRQQDRIATPVFSPDGSRIAIRGMEQGNYDIWVQSVDSPSRTRVSSNLAIDADPVWAPSGDRLVWRADREGNAQIYTRSIDGQDEEAPLIQGPSADRPLDWAPGDRLIYATSDFGVGADLWIAQPGSDGGAIQTRPLLESRFNETSGRISPDGLYLAYCSDESGVLELYVQPFGAPDGRPVQVSQNGGCQPRWSRSGDELFFVSGSTLYSASIIPGPRLIEGPPVALFQHPSLSTSSPFMTTYDVSPQADSFVLVETLEPPPSATSGSVVRVVQNWFAELRTPR